MEGALYDLIGRGYTTTRRPDPRLAAAIWDALGDAESVVNVGAGTGAYEPDDRQVVAVEPSTQMIAQRPQEAVTVVQARAEQLPFPADSFDAAMSVFSDHHWRDRRQGFSELRRVARRRVVLFNANPGEAELFWLTEEYLRGFLELIPARYRVAGAWERELQAAFGNVNLVPVPIPHDCSDGFYGAFWRRPEAYLDRQSGPASQSSTGCRLAKCGAASRRSPRTSSQARGSLATADCSSCPSCTSAITSRSPSSIERFLGRAGACRISFLRGPSLDQARDPFPDPARTSQGRHAPGGAATPEPAPTAREAMDW